MNETQMELGKQINVRELKFARFTVMLNKETGIIVQKGKRFMVIDYNHGSDLYDLRIGSRNNNFELKEHTVEGVYFDSLRGFIENHFKFEYVMDGLMASMRR